MFEMSFARMNWDSSDMMIHWDRDKIHIQPVDERTGLHHDN